ncbi:ergothioneine biosynthesis protein EgtB [Prauserella rugosa]|uniref:Hercynine oxygenase n=1 Tax=Prauserella rugosa TaxID=43354 RepID=A0A660CBQ6_9PSEU|nr:ergothioneine biosynthesis protein EgtB [Prauserella rugosa]KMS86783.1 sulfatase-modifying factor 1 [Streptomyces regensis]TWH19193.1 iron(II)-dependent oxidoreductase [Prauserella rugosa]
MSTETSPQTPARTPSATANGNVAPEDIRVRAAAALERARTRTAALTDIDDDELTRQHSRLMSPLVWDLAHVGSQEEIWLVRDVGGREPLRPDIDELYDAFRHARADRPALPLLGPAEARAYVDQVRRKALDTLESAPMEGRRLTESAFAFGMIAQHEQQHDETMLATHQLRRGEPLLHAPAPPVRRAGPAPEEVVVPAGRFVMGTSAEPWALDNERPAHEVFVDGFAIDTFPVTCDRYAAFVDAGGYRDPRWWSTEGWDYITAHGITAPRFWRFDGGRWWRRRFGVYEPVPDDEPVLHVSFHEAEAYAAWAGRRLPTEAEWEKAARHDPATGRSRRYPWGDDEPGPDHANLGQRHLRPAPVGAYPAGASPLGVHQLIGDVWEWTSSDFAGYPGFQAFPYAEYSEVFFGGRYKVLRGGSFGTDPVAIRGTFRNWDFPIRRQIFTGFRCARDLAPGEG